MHDGQSVLIGPTRHYGVVPDDGPDLLHAASIVRALANRVRSGDLDGRQALPFLLGAAAALEAQAAATGGGSASEGPPAST